jgi:hypothetical protein
VPDELGALVVLPPQPASASAPHAASAVSVNALFDLMYNETTSFIGRRVLTTHG